MKVNDSGVGGKKQPKAAKATKTALPSGKGQRGNKSAKAIAGPKVRKAPIPGKKRA
jgi:hypothetical protein